MGPASLVRRFLHVGYINVTRFFPLSTNYRGVCAIAVLVTTVIFLITPTLTFNCPDAENVPVSLPPLQESLPRQPTPLATHKHMFALRLRHNRYIDTAAINSRMGCWRDCATCWRCTVPAGPPVALGGALC